MKILWLTWKDRKHPLAGGAEIVNEELARRLAAEGHEVTLLVGGYDGCPMEEKIDGYTVRRFVSRTSVAWWPLRCWQMFRYYRRHLRGWPDLVIDEVNTMPFFAKYYVSEPNLLFVHMLCRQIWFYQFPLPFSLAGYLLEPLYLRLLNDRRVITISDSTKQDLMRQGFRGQDITIISEGIELEPLADPASVRKFDRPTVLSLGAIRPMKRTDQQIKAFEIAKRSQPDLQLKIAGDAAGSYGRKVLEMIRRSPAADSIEYLGNVTKEQKISLMRQSHALLVTSVKEGWGLVVTEAASQGTPALVYDVDGLRDSVQHGVTGLVTSRNTPESLAEAITAICKDKRKSAKMGAKAWRQSRQVTFDRSFSQFKQALGIE